MAGTQAHETRACVLQVPVSSSVARLVVGMVVAPREFVIRTNTAVAPVHVVPSITSSMHTRCKEAFLRVISISGCDMHVAIMRNSGSKKYVMNGSYTVKLPEETTIVVHVREEPKLVSPCGVMITMDAHYALQEFEHQKLDLLKHVEFWHAHWRYTRMTRVSQSELMEAAGLV